MKPVTALSLVVIAVLATVVVEETRIKKLNAELTALRALRATEPSQKPPAGNPSETGPAETPAADTPAVAADPPATGAPSARQLPPDFPEPDAPRLQQLALGDRAGLYLELGLTSREQAYLEDLLAEWRQARAKLCAEWIATAEDGRAAVMASIQQAEEGATGTLRTFFGDDSSFERFMAHLAAQPERDLFRQMAPLMDAKGFALEMAKEEQVIEALFRLREIVGGVDWTSPAALEFLADGTARERFTMAWDETGKALPEVLRPILTEDEVKAVIEARESLREGLLGSLPGPQ